MDEYKIIVDWVEHQKLKAQIKTQYLLKTPAQGNTCAGKAKIPTVSELAKRRALPQPIIITQVVDW